MTPGSDSPRVTHPAIRIRPEQPGDESALAAVVAAAFSGAEHSTPPLTPGGPPGEVDLLAWLRKDDAWLPGLALVAVVDEDGADRIVGQVTCTRAEVDGAPALGLGPVSVQPDLQRRGVGSAMVREVLARAEAEGETLVALVGDPAYYARFGFAPAARLGVRAPDPAYGDFFQALSLGTGDHPRGRFRYAAAFDRLEEALRS